MYDHIREISAVNYRFSHFYKSRTEPNFEKRISDVHSSHHYDLGKLFSELKWCSDAENEWLTWIVTNASYGRRRRLDLHSSKARVEKAADCTSLENFRNDRFPIFFNRSHEKIILNVRDSFMDEFKLNKTIIKVYMHIASKISVVIQRLSHVWPYKGNISC